MSSLGVNGDFASNYISNAFEFISKKLLSKGLTLTQ